MGEKFYHVIVGGAGIVGSAIFRELTKYDIKVLLIEKENDVCSFGSTIANTGIIHGGYDPLPNSLKAVLNREGNIIWKDLTKKLNIPSSFLGIIVLAFNEDEEKLIYELKNRGDINKVPVEIVSRDEILKLEPNLRKDVKLGLLSLNGGTIDPFIATFNLIKNGFENGGEVSLGEKILEVYSEGKYLKVKSNKNSYLCEIFINSLGFFGREFLNDKSTIYPRRGQYLIVDRQLENLVNRPIFGVPSDKGKGVAITKTVHGNILLGPTSYKVDSYDLSSTKLEREEILEKVKNFIDFDFEPFIIRDYVGIRASSKTKDFIIEFDKNILHVQGIDSPGLTSAPAIAIYIKDLIKKRINLVDKRNFKDFVEPIKKVKDLNKDEIDELIKKDKNFGEIVCRCEIVTKGEILQALKNFPKPTSIDGLKRRLRVTGGRCQGSYCLIKIIEILNKELDINFEKIYKGSEGSNIVYGEIE